ncbi:hypothetical protein CU098_005713, partial [Rhizopus stolonifer]
MIDTSNERQPLTLSNMHQRDHSDDSILTPPLTAHTTTSSNGTLVDIDNILDVRYYKNFEHIASDIRFNIEECYQHIERIQEAQKAVYEHASEADSIAQKNRSILETQTVRATERTNYIRKAMAMIEPSKPTLSDLDLRNQQFKMLLRSFKDLLEKYINVTLESQRFTSVLFERQIKVVNPLATPFDLERAISSTGDDSPSIFVQILMQRGVRKNDQQTQDLMKIVQDIHQDLRQLATTFARLSEMRNEVNIMVERYRRRWPVIVKEGNLVYVIDDDLNLLEQTLV